MFARSLYAANVASAVVLYPILKRRSEILRELSLGLRLTFKGFLPSSSRLR